MLGRYRIPPAASARWDELFEILTLQQTRRAPPMPIVLFGRDYGGASSISTGSSKRA